jgi:OOP family OmpA-OmpF porin
MTALPTRIAILILALSFVTSAQAQFDEWYIAPAIVHTDDDGDRNIDDSVAGMQIAVGRDITEKLSFEGLLGYSSIAGSTGPGIIHPDQDHLDISANLLAFFDRERTFSPYLIVGIGYLGLSTDALDDDGRASATAGLGFMWKMGQSKFSIRGEYRARYAYTSCSKDCPSLTDFIGSIGVHYSFGERAEPIRKSGFDSDNDGVIDHWDVCPNTPHGTAVDENGCPLQVREERDDDADGDRVYDNIDECPNTPSGVPVDPVGCSLDSDRDGVTTDKDRCPNSPAGAVVDIYGCSGDDDDDGVLNHLDKCPNTTAGARIDVNGCEFTDVIELPGVNFGSGSDLLLPGTDQLLKFAAATLNRYPELVIEVAGHTDSDGAATANYGLSERRAKTVRDYLIRFGVDGKRLTIRGYGESQPVANNATVPGRATNRRVELRVVSR